MVFVQTKIDLIDEAVVRVEEVEGLAKEIGLVLYRTCSKDNIMISDVFEYLAKKYVNEKDKNQGDSNGIASGPISTPADIKKMGEPAKKSLHGGAA